MNDYKELIEMLREMSVFFVRKEADSAGVSETLVTSMNAEACKDAADAIEHLVKERDEWMEYAKQERKRSIERYHELAVELDRVKEERDAYAKAFCILRTDEPLTNHAVYKIDYGTLANSTTEELVLAVAYGLVSRMYRKEK